MTSNIHALAGTTNHERKCQHIVLSYKLKLTPTGGTPDPESGIIFCLSFRGSDKKKPHLLETEDSSSAGYCVLNNKVRGWPPQNDK
jgi:hypothetical protein